MSFGRIEHLWTDLLEFQTPHHGVEEDFEEVEMIFIGGLHELDPLDIDLVLGAVVFSLVLRKVSNFSETEHVESPVDEELKLLSDLVLDVLENSLSQWTRVVWYLRLEFDGVLVNTLDVLVELKLVVVGVELLYLSSSFGISLWLLWEEGNTLGGLHS